MIVTGNQENKLRGLMGLCVRARQAVFGEDGCMKTIRAGNCGVLLLDSGASQATRDKYRGVCANANTPMVELPQGLLHEATGKPGMAMAILKGGFANQAIQMTKPTDTVNHSGGASVE